MKTRVARAADADALVALADLAIPGAWTREALVSELSREIAEVRVAEDARGLAGFAIAWRVAGEAEILLVAVHPERRREGIGTALLAALESSSGAEVVHLEVRARNAAARALYARRGYAVTGVRRGYYADDGDDAVTMAKRLR